MEFIKYISTYATTIPAIICLFIFYKADKKFLPIVLLIFVSPIADLLGNYWIKSFRNNIVIVNIYSILEVLLIIWQFSRWKLFENLRTPRLIAMAFAILYMIDLMIPAVENIYTFYFNIISSFLIVIMGILQINKVLLTGNKMIIKNPVFLICIGLILFFTTLAIVDVFYFYGYHNTIALSINMYNLVKIMNIITSLIFAVALFYIPKKRQTLL
jgi:hypothetical protein